MSTKIGGTPSAFPSGRNGTTDAPKTDASTKETDGAALKAVGQVVADTFGPAASFVTQLPKYRKNKPPFRVLAAGSLA